MKPQTTLVALTASAFTWALSVGAAESLVLPWQREIPLREAAKSVALIDTLNPTSPLPSGEYFGGAAMSINNLKMRTTLWGLPDRVTVSLNKNNVWDRRVPPRAFKAPTLQEVIDGANSPANKDYVGRARTDQRPKEYGYLRKEGGSYDAWRQPIEYPFPCLKPVGQIIIGMDAFHGIPPPTASQSCADGLVTLRETNGECIVFSAMADHKYRIEPKVL
jgi:hypothetical protein